MHLYDISQTLQRAPVYPGDPEPRTEQILRMDMGDKVNLSAFYQCTHNGTHAEASAHFYEDGETIDQIPLETFVGECTVITVPEGILTGNDIEERLPEGAKRVLLKGGGKSFLSQSSAFVLADAGLSLVGIDSQSVGAPGEENAPHKELLGKNIPLLEGLDLSAVPMDGRYFLFAVPLKIEGVEAAPVRAILADGIFIL